MISSRLSLYPAIQLYFVLLKIRYRVRKDKSSNVIRLQIRHVECDILVQDCVLKISKGHTKYFYIDYKH